MPDEDIDFSVFKVIHLKYVLKGVKINDLQYI